MENLNWNPFRNLKSSIHKFNPFNTKYHEAKFVIHLSYGYEKCYTA